MPDPAEPSPKDAPAPIVVVAEDDADVLHLVCSALDGAGFRAVAALDAEGAATLLDRDEVVLLVTDVGLGDGSGVELAARARRARADLPVLFVSGRPDLDHGLDGPVEVLGKPFSVIGLVNGARRLAARTSAQPAPNRGPAPVRPAVAPGLVGSGVEADLVGRLLDARDEELAGIAGHLHDDHLQKLAAVTLRLGLMRRRGFVTPEGETEVAELEQVLLAAADRIRAQILDLSPPWLEDAALGSSLDAIAVRHPGVGLRLVDDAAGGRDLRIGRRGHRILAALVGELATWSLEETVEVAADGGEAGTTVRVTAVGSPPTGPRPALRAEELATLNGVAVEVDDLEGDLGTGSGGERLRRRWTLRFA